MESTQKNQNTSGGQNTFFLPQNNPTWVPDSQAVSCTNCFKKFGIINRRHHCRLCGLIFCKNCSQETTTHIGDTKDQKVRLCNKCNEINNTFNQDLEKNKPLLQNQLNQNRSPINQVRDQTLGRSSENLFFSPKNNQEGRQSFGFAVRNMNDQNTDTLTSDAFNTGFQQEQSEYKRRLSIAKPENRKTIIDELRSDLAQKSIQQHDLIQKYLKMNHYDNDMGDQNDKVKHEAFLDNSQRRDNSIHERNFTEIIDKNFEIHLENMVKLIMTESKIDIQKWFQILYKSTKETIEKVRPTSIMLNDSIDLNKFVKIVTVHHPNQSKCRTVEGVVFKKDIANRRMRSNIVKPRILLLANSLGYVQEDGLALADLEREIEQEDTLIRIIKMKIEQVNPDVIFIEKDASRLVLDMLVSEKRTVITNTPPKMLKMIERCTQTIICPNSNFISKGFKIGECGLFKIEQMKGMDTTDLYQQQTSLLCLEGCLQELGCSIILSGSDLTELKRIRHALRRCITLARSLYHEKQYLKFIKPDLEFIPDKDEDFKNESMQIEFENQKPQFLQNIDTNSHVRSSINAESCVQDQRITAPFLFDKMMERQSLIFEHFSLAFPQKNQVDEDEDSHLMEFQNQTQILNETAKFDDKQSRAQQMISNKDDLRQEDEGIIQRKNTKIIQDVSEADIKRKLKKMCTKPQRFKIEFYNEKSDKSVFTMVKQLALNTFNNCQLEGCQKPRLAHTDYWYHGSGCVEIKLVLVEDIQKVSTEQVKRQLELPQQVLIYAFCNKCQSMVIKKRVAPTDLLEMSFFKFLEQFFYNQNVRTCLYNAHQKPCRHVFFVDTSILFRYGPVKIKFQFEKLPEYTLDMIHFGSTQGIFSQQVIHQKVRDNFLKLVENFQKSLFWIQEKSTLISNWVLIATDELPQILNTNSQDLSQSLQALSDYLKSFQSNFKEFTEFVSKKLFRSSQDEKMKGILEKLKSPTQGGRIQKILSDRLCEYIYLIKKVQQFICESLFIKFLPKKQTLQQFLLPNDRLDESFVSVDLAHSSKAISTKSGNHISEKVDKDKGNLLLNREQSNSAIAAPSSLRKEYIPSADQIERNATFVEDAYVNQKLIPQHNNPSNNLRREFKEIYDFETHLKANKNIEEVITHCSFIPLGFNQGGVRINPADYDFSSIIAMTLNSNLYLSGLKHMDYMEMKEKLVTFPKLQDGVAVKAGEIFGAAQKMIQLNASDRVKSNIQLGVSFGQDQDVLNAHVAFALAEAELTKPTDWQMSLEFSTTQKPLLKIEQDGQNHIISEESGNQTLFYSQDEQIIDFGPLIEQPVSKSLFDHLQHAINFQPSTQSKLALSGMQNKSILESQKGNMNQDKTPEFGSTLTPVTGNNPSKSQLLDFARTEIYHMYNEEVQFTVKVYFPGHFEALRKIYCGGYSNFIQSFMESHYWKDNTGGKSRSTFFMSSDQKYVIKAVKSNEIKMFEEMSGSYFDYMKESFARQCPTTIAKTLGIFKIKIRLNNNNRSEQFYLLIMENLLLHCDENCVRYDLKGSRRNRYVMKKTQQEVALDNNFIQDYKSKPIPMQYSMKRLLSLAIHNDSLYLSKQSIIDYSMFVIINPQKKTVRLGIIDYIQQYTIEKSIESYLKSNVYQEEPTIVSPELYKQRFRTAMDKYFVAMIPDRDSNLHNLFNNLFSANQIQWFTKKTDKSVV